MTVTTDGFLPAAVNAGLLADSLLAAETLEEGRADAMAPAESISMTPGNATEPAAFSATPVGGGRQPLESLGAASVLGDEFALLEMLGRQQLDTLPRVENILSQRFDASPTAEALAGQRANSSLWFDTLTRALRDASVLLESTGSASLVRDRFVALESLAGQRSDPRASIAWQASVVFDDRASIEITAIAAGGTITAGALAIIEWLSRQTAEAPAPADSAATAGTDTVNQAEVLARAVRKASSQIETLGQAAAFVDAFIALEVGREVDIANVLMCENLNSSPGASFVILESWTMPLAEIAPGRLLKSPGKIRILVKRQH